jgi:hypothetical protein
MTQVRKKIQRLLVLFIFGVLALNYPLLTLFSKKAMVFGIPLLYFYLFAIWLLFILFIGLVVERKKTAKASFPLLKSRKTD